MDASFWKQRWENNDISFHRTEANPMLVKHFEALAGVMGAAAGRRMFLPLCGKSLDIGWLLARGYRVAGAELSRMAIEQLFAGLGVEPRIAKTGSLEHFSADGIDIFVGDIFELTAEKLGAVDGIYDRGALVALPETMRRRYSAHLMEMTRQAPQLLIAYDYDQSLRDGPPFAINEAELNRLYGGRYELSLLGSVKASGPTMGNYPAHERAWLLKGRND
jgi:thiopurine S-methyltransferase